MVPGPLLEEGEVPLDTIPFRGVSLYHFSRYWIRCPLVIGLSSTTALLNKNLGGKEKGKGKDTQVRWVDSIGVISVAV